MTTTSLHPGTNLEHPSLVEELQMLGGGELLNVASAPKVAASQLIGSRIRGDHQAFSDIVLISSSPSRLSVSVDRETDQILRLCPNTIVFFRHGRTYEIDYADCDRLLALTIEPIWLQQIASWCDAPNPYDSRPEINPILHPETPPVVDAINRRLSYGKRTHERFLMLNTELLMSHYFWSQAGEKHVPPRSVALSTTRLQLILELIEQGLGGRVLVSELAEIAGMTPAQFSRSFKDSLGTTPQSYILDRRMNLCQTLLETTKMPLAELAYEAGFSSQAHMTATFARKFGYSPGEFRKSIMALAKD